MLCLFGSCSQQKNSKEQEGEDLNIEENLLSGTEDSFPDSLLIVTDTLPATVDNSFDDFFYNFVTDSVFQLKRVSFPIYFFEKQKANKITAQQWKYLPLFSVMPAYNIIFDRAEDMWVEKDTSQEKVQVEEIYLQNKQMKQYTFQKKNGLWLLASIQMLTTKDYEEEGEDFLDFYVQFARDSVFQRQRLYNPLAFVTPDPEDEFKIFETVLDEGQWFAFRPPIATDVLTNILYGQTNNSSSRTKIVEFRGFGNGFNNVLHFEKMKGIWKLVRFEDLSD